MRRVILGIVAAVLVLGGGLMTPASAESGSMSTPKGDAPAKIDITRFSVDNDRRWVYMKVDVRNLRQKGKFNFHYWMGNGGTPPPRSALVVVRQEDKHTLGRFFSCGLEDCSPAPCPRLRVSWRPAEDVVRIAVPQRCFPRPADNPDGPPPSSGRFYAWSSLGDAVDDTDGLLALRRG
jgi:hypothetical protein